MYTGSAEFDMAELLANFPASPEMDMSFLSSPPTIARHVEIFVGVCFNFPSGNPPLGENMTKKSSATLMNSLRSTLKKVREEVLNAIKRSKSLTIRRLNREKQDLATSSAGRRDTKSPWLH
jgi:uncharacterized membrane protein YgaE (UPF0421/DUF939 family)